MKTYKALSILSIPVSFPGGSTRVTFEQGMGGGVYITDDKEIQQGIEDTDYFKRGDIQIVYSDEPEEPEAEKQTLAEVEPEAEKQTLAEVEPAKVKKASAKVKKAKTEKK